MERTFLIKVLEVTLTDQGRLKLLRHLNWKHEVSTNHDKLKIPHPNLCSNYPHCAGCPFGGILDRFHECGLVHIFRELLGNLAFTPSCHYITYSRRNREKVHLQLERVRLVFSIKKRRRL